MPNNERNDKNEKIRALLYLVCDRHINAHLFHSHEPSSLPRSAIQNNENGICCCELQRFCHY